MRCDAMQYDAMRRSLRKYEHFGMIDDSEDDEGVESERGRGAGMRHERRHDIHVNSCVCVHAQVPLPLTT